MLISNTLIVFISHLEIYVPKLKFCPDPTQDPRCSLNSLRLHPLTFGNLLMWFQVLNICVGAYLNLGFSSVYEDT